MVIVLQGAMDEEINIFLEYFKPQEKILIGGFDFHIANYFDNKIIISKTEIGLINASMATTIAILNFKPDLVINQGCAGSHTVDLKIGDLIIAEKSVYINNFNTIPRRKNEGSDSLSWLPSTKRSYIIDSTSKYVEIANNINCWYNKYVGTIGSGDMFSREFDRINYLHKLFGEHSEDMESVAVFKVCEKFGVNRIGFRIISNNELLGEEFERSTCQTVQRFSIDFVEKITEIK